MAIFIDRLDLVYTNLTQIWVDFAEKRRFLRSCGVDEAVVVKKYGDFALFSAYVTHLSEKNDLWEKGMAELASLSDFPLPEEKNAKTLWAWGCDAMGLGISAKTLAEKSTTPVVLPLTQDVAGWKGDAPIVSLDSTLAFSVRSETVAQLLELLKNRLDAFEKIGCRSVMLTVSERLPACLRIGDDDADKTLSALIQGGQGISEKKQEALKCRLLFGVLPMIRERKMPLILRAGAERWGDGLFDCRFDAKSLLAYAERLGDEMPKIALCPRSAQAREDMERLIGVLPAIDGEAAVCLIENYFEEEPLLARHT